MTKTIIIGGGEIGQAMAKLCRPGTLLGILDINKARATLTDPKILTQADVVCVCVPATALRPALLTYRSYLKPNALVVTLTKGVEKGSGKLTSEVLEEELKQTRALLSGGMIAEEIIQGRKVEAVVASNSKKAYQLVREILTEQITLAYTPAVKTVAFLAVLKNVYALGAGILAGLGAIEAEQKNYLEKALGEMRKIVSLAGGVVDLVDGPAGRGDLLATSASLHSANRAAGLALARHEKISPTEGTRTLHDLTLRLGDKIPTLSLWNILRQIVVKGAAPATLLQSLSAGHI